MRTQAEVDALWPDADHYAIIGTISAPGAITPADAAGPLRGVYDGHNAVAGLFKVEYVEKGTAIATVRFQRDVTDDCEVVNDELLAGKDLKAVLVEQLRTEIQASIEDTGTGIRLLSLGENVEFYNFSHPKAI